MKVDMVLNSCPGAFADIHAYVESIGFVTSFKGELALLGKLHHLCCLFRRAIREIGHVFIRTNQDMSGRVGENV